MLIKFETKTARVKGISFHPTRTWILASLHTGTIVLWDYQLKNCLDKFEGHDGPVRGLDFHENQPIFVSGGDDYTIKVWNYQKSKCLFSLNGHADYIRSTSFHSKHPWILSASDDQTVRIWNWQNRTKISLLTGHNHYVMYAEFHPTEDLVVSASLDQSIRVWDISTLVKRHTSALQTEAEKQAIKGNLHNVDIFGESNTITRFVLEGHDKGVNWATFHPTLPLILSGGDDRYVKLWRMGEDKCWEVDTFRGHYKNVSSVNFHPRQPLLLSASEDKAIRVWDTAKRICLHTFRHKHDRFWIIKAHPTKNLFCAGHDSGLMIFKLERERPIWTLHENILFYIKEKYLRRSNLTTGQDVSIMRLRGEGRGNYSSMSFNPAENSILLNNQESGYELYMVPIQTDISLPPSSPRDYKKSAGRSAAWIGRNRFAVLLNETSLHIKNCKNEVSKKIHIPFNSANIFPAGLGMLLILQQSINVESEKGASNLVLYDVQQKQAVATLKTTCKISRVVWSNDKSRVALLAKNCITLCNRKLDVFASWVETGKVKSGAWMEPSSELGVFVYNTSGHLKYAFTNGDIGTIRTLDVCMYIVSVDKEEILCFNRETKPYKFKMDTTELSFKMSLITGNYDQVLQIIRSSKLIGQAIISYLHRKGYPEIALHFLEKQDERTRFNLALECCNMDVALDCARVLKSTSVWNKLGEMALLLGNHQIVELCYQRTKNVHKLAFLYLVTGNMEKLKKLLKTSASQGHHGSLKFWMALVTGDVENQINLLRNVDEGKPLLAHMLSIGNGLVDTTAEIASEFSQEQLEKVNKNNFAENFHVLRPPVPLFENQENWPRLVTSKSLFENVSQPSYLKLDISDEESHETCTAMGGAWAEEEVIEISDDGKVKIEQVGIPDVGAGGGWDDESCDIVLPSSSTSNMENGSTDNFYVAPVKGLSVPGKWINAYSLPAVHVISGNFESATRLLQQQIGVVNVEPFKQIFLNAYNKSHATFTALPNIPPLSLFPTMDSGKREIRLPMACMTLNSLGNEKLKTCYEMVSRGQFKEAIQAFQNLLLTVPLTIVQSKPEISKAQELVTLCKEYILGLQMEMFRKTLGKDTAHDQRRSLELAAYFTHCSMDNVHLILALRTAMNLSFKLGYFKTASGFARRLLELGPAGDLVTQARKLLKACEIKNDSSPGTLEYDEHNPFAVCAQTYKAIYKGKAEVACPFCTAVYLPEFNGKLCNVCMVAEVGKSALGLKISLIQFR